MRARDFEEELVPTRWVEGPLNRETSDRTLDAEIGELRDAVERLIEQRKHVDTAKVRKDDALKTYDRN